MPLDPVCLLLPKVAEGAEPTPGSPCLTLIELKSLTQDLLGLRGKSSAHRWGGPKMGGGGQGNTASGVLAALLP